MSLKKKERREEERGGELFASVYANLAFPPGRETDAVARAAKFGWFKRVEKRPQHFSEIGTSRGCDQMFYQFNNTGGGGLYH